MMRSPVVENICRTDLTPIEEAEAFDRLLKLKSCKQEDLATMLSKTPAFGLADPLPEQASPDHPRCLPQGPPPSPSGS